MSRTYSELSASSSLIDSQPLPQSQFSNCSNWSTQSHVASQVAKLDSESKSKNILTLREAFNKMGQNFPEMLTDGIDIAVRFVFGL